MSKYTTFLTVEPIGKAILGEQEYQRLLEDLAPGEQGLFILSRGDYSFVPEDFRPHTVPNRLNLVQNDFPIAIRDVDFYNFYDYQFAIDIPEYSEMMVLRLVRRDLRYRYPCVWNSVLIITPRYGDSSTLLPSRYPLPSSLFMDNPMHLYKNLSHYG